MTNLETVLTQLRRERDSLNEAIAALEAIGHNGSAPKSGAHGIISEAGRERIAAAQRARWAKFRSHQKVVRIPKRTSGSTRVISAAARERIAAAQKARWAKWRKQQKTA